MAAASEAANRTLCYSTNIYVVALYVYYYVVECGGLAASVTSPIASMITLDQMLQLCVAVLIRHSCSHLCYWTDRRAPSHGTQPTIDRSSKYSQLQHPPQRMQNEQRCSCCHFSLVRARRRSAVRARFEP